MLGLCSFRVHCADGETPERMTATIWQDEAARVRLEAWCERFQSRIEVPVESRTVPTRHGPTHVLLAGPVAPP